MLREDLLSGQHACGKAKRMRKKRDAKWLSEVGDRLEALRVAFGHDQVDMATIAGASQAAYSNYVRGERPLDIEAAMALCRRFQVTLDWIYRGDPSGLPYALAEKLIPKLSTVVPLPRRR